MVKATVKGTLGTDNENTSLVLEPRIKIFKMPVCICRIKVKCFLKVLALLSLTVSFYSIGCKYSKSCTGQTPGCFYWFCNDKSVCYTSKNHK